MTQFKLGARSLERLVGVHPDLDRVVRLAIQRSKQDFSVIEGVRSRERAWINFGQGRDAAACKLAGCPPHYARPEMPKVTWVKRPLGTKHLPQPDGYGHAVDIWPWPRPADNNRPGSETLAMYAAIATAMKSAADDLHVPLVVGGEWKVSPDYPHFELGKRSDQA